jgi:hypothetical protein
MAESQLVARYASIVSPGLIMGLSIGMVSGLTGGLRPEIRQLREDGLAAISPARRSGQRAGVGAVALVVVAGLILSLATASLTLSAVLETLVVAAVAGLVVGLIVGVVQATLRAIRLVIILIIVVLPLYDLVVTSGSTRVGSGNVPLGLAAVVAIGCLALSVELGSQLGARLRPSIEVFEKIMPIFRVMSLPVAGFTVGYLAVALWFASTFAFVNTLDRRAFVELNLKTGDYTLTPNESGTFGDFLYFSMTTNPPLGYSEIRPVSTVARTLVTLESILGTGWIVIVFAAILAYVTPRIDDILKQTTGETTGETRSGANLDHKMNGQHERLLEVPRSEPAQTVVAEPTLAADAIQAAALRPNYVLANPSAYSQHGTGAPVVND